MKFLPYVLKHLRKNWLRTSSTIAALALSIFLICTLQTFIRAINSGLESANSTRIVTRHAVSLVFNIPVAFGPRIANVEGVKRVAAANWFGGTNPNDPSEFFAQFAIDPEPYFAMHPEYVIEDSVMTEFMAERRAAIIGEGVRRRFGYDVGDTIQLESFIPPYRKGEPFEFVVKGIYKADEARYPGTLDQLMFFHFEYLYEGTNRNCNVATYMVEIEDAGQAANISATIDELFVNSDSQTRTETEQAFRASFVSLSGNLALLLNVVGLAVSFTILLVTANTMSMAVRERKTEIAVLKTLGFPSGLVMALILAEAAVLGILGGGLGIALAYGIIDLIPKIPGLDLMFAGLPGISLSPTVAVLGLSIAVFMGLAAGFTPSFLAYRARVTDSLRQL